MDTETLLAICLNKKLQRHLHPYFLARTANWEANIYAIDDQKIVLLRILCHDSFVMDTHTHTQLFTTFYHMITELNLFCSTIPCPHLIMLLKIFNADIFFTIHTLLKRFIGSLFESFRGFSKGGEVEFGCVMLSIKFDVPLLSGVDFASAAARFFDNYGTGKPGKNGKRASQCQ